jgi:maleate isomerase
MNRPYHLTDPLGRAARLGLIVLQVDETIEHDFRRLFASDDIALYVSRIPSGAELTPDTIAQMKRDLPAAAALLPQTDQLDAVAYACTSGTTLIGTQAVADLVTNAVPTAQVCDPLTATLQAFFALRSLAVGIVSPYIPEVATPISDAFNAAGLSVPATVSFNERVEANVARIDSHSIREAALELGRRRDTDAVFLSCTNLQTLDLIEPLEAELGKPVISSNLALAWQMARANSNVTFASAPGKLARTGRL